MKGTCIDLDRHFLLFGDHQQNNVGDLLTESIADGFLEKMSTNKYMMLSEAPCEERVRALVSTGHTPQRWSEMMGNI